jgi:hypothetical protein
MFALWLDGTQAELQMLRMCAQEGGLRVHRTVSGVEGVLGIGVHPTDTDKGYRFYELEHPRASLERRIYRRDRLPDGSLVESYRTEPEARFELQTTNGRIQTWTYHVVWQDLVLRDRITGEVLAQDREISGWSGIVRGALVRAYPEGSGQRFCPNEKRLRLTTLLPSIAQPPLSRGNRQVHLIEGDRK